jgi:hypothetical protein
MYCIDLKRILGREEPLSGVVFKKEILTIIVLQMLKRVSGSGVSGEPNWVLSR